MAVLPTSLPQHGMPNCFSEHAFLSSRPLFRSILAQEKKDVCKGQTFAVKLCRETAASRGISWTKP